MNPGGSWTVHPVANSILNLKTHAVILQTSLSPARKESQVWKGASGDSWPDHHLPHLFLDN